MSIEIIDVKVVGNCSKHGKQMKDKYGKVIKDKDIWCFECDF